MVNFQELQAHLKNKLLTDSSYRERWDDSEIKFTEEGFEFTSANGVSFNVSKTGITEFYYDGYEVNADDLSNINIPSTQLELMFKHLSNLMLQMHEDKIREIYTEEPEEQKEPTPQVPDIKYMRSKNRNMFMTGFILGKNHV